MIKRRFQRLVPLSDQRGNRAMNNSSGTRGFWVEMKCRFSFCGNRPRQNRQPFPRSKVIKFFPAKALFSGNISPAPDVIEVTMTNKKFLAIAAAAVIALGGIVA